LLDGFRSAVQIADGRITVTISGTSHFLVTS
jgi:hypothetical protein